MNVIEAHDLGMRYGKVVALDHVSLTVPEGSIYAVLGPNGAGKTTLFDLLVNLQRPTAGKAEVLGSDSRELQSNRFEQIGYVSEDQEFPEWMTIRYFLDYLKPFYPSWDEARASELIAQFQLPVDRKLKHLSRGMRMKVFLTASMAYRPRLLVLDEPFSGLDPLTREELTQALLEGANETTVVLSSHDLPEIETFVTHVCYLDDGQLRFAEEISQLSTRFCQISIILDAPNKLDPWPSNWICFEAAEGHIQFVDTAFDASRTMAEVSSLYPDARMVEKEAMPLRSIFIALARERKLIQPEGDQ